MSKLKIRERKPGSGVVGGRLLLRHHDFFLYIVFGFLASVINILTFMILHNQLRMALIYANTLAFFVSNFFSFIMNKRAVFIDHTGKSLKTDKGLVLSQLGLFFLYRLLSLIPDNLVMLIGLNVLAWNTFIVKIINQIVVGIFNYVTTKSVFKRETSRLRQYIQKRDKKREP